MAPTKVICATDKLIQEFKKVDGIVELTNNNDNLKIYAINTETGYPKNAAYCGIILYNLCKKAGFNLEIPRSQAGMARNWRRYGEVVWDSYNGWKPGANKVPGCNEIFIVAYNWNGQNHVGAALYFHGGINFITGEGNTGMEKVRTPAHTQTDFVGKSTAKIDGVYVKVKVIRGKPQQGIFLGKERYATAGLVHIIKYVVQ